MLMLLSLLLNRDPTVGAYLPQRESHQLLTSCHEHRLGSVGTFFQPASQLTLTDALLTPFSVNFSYHLLDFGLQRTPPGRGGCLTRQVSVRPRG